MLEGCRPDEKSVTSSVTVCKSAAADLFVLFCFTIVQGP